MRRNILIPATAAAAVATALYFWYEERKKQLNQERRSQIDDMTSLVAHAKMVVQTPRPQFMETPPSPLTRRSVTDVIDTRDSPTDADTDVAPETDDRLLWDTRPMNVLILLLSYLALITIVSSVITLYRLC